LKGRLPFGPFDSGLRMPLSFEFELEGSLITSAELRAGTGHCNVELGFEAVTPLTGLMLAERICRRSSIAHAFACCMALEDAMRIEVAAGPSACRVLLAEYERVAGHLGVISDIGRSLEDDIVYRGPRRYIARIREAFRRASGNPFGFGMIAPGGVRLEDETAFDGIRSMARALERDTVFWRRKLMLSRGRLKGARLSSGDIPEGYPPAPALRAAGYARDLRSGEAAYGYYQELSYRPVARVEGRTLDRVLLLLDEIGASLQLVGEINDRREAFSGVLEDIGFHQGKGVGVCESPEGAIEHTVFLGSDGTILRNRISCAVEGVAGLATGALSGTSYFDVVPSLLSFYLCHACQEL